MVHAKKQEHVVLQMTGKKEVLSLHFAFIISNESLKSQACNCEYTYADEVLRPILPIVVLESYLENWRIMENGVTHPEQDVC